MPQRKGPEAAQETEETRKRVRDNQRRSRLRQKELIADLQKRLDEYQRLGVQATQEMQREARHVVGENEKLRSLLRQKGVSNAEVEGFLRSPSTTPISQPISRQPMVPVVPDMHHLPPAVSGFMQPEVPVRLHHYSHPAPARRSQEQATRLVTPTTNEKFGLSSFPEQLGTRESTYASQVNVNAGWTTELGPSEQSTLSSPPDHYNPREPTLSSQAKLNACCTSATEMSCDVAAAILADMQGHTDTSRAREVLGCTGPSDCVVKSIRVFDLLDKAA